MFKYGEIIKLILMNIKVSTNAMELEHKLSRLEEILNLGVVFGWAGTAGNYELSFRIYYKYTQIDIKPKELEELLSKEVIFNDEMYNNLVKYLLELI